jgi:23S rRNA pseudouridine1911/1915/1917 synthase
MNTIAKAVRELLDVPWSRARELVASGRVRVDGERILDPATRIADDARVEVEISAPRLRPGVLPREAMLYFDADVVVVNKPAGILTVPYEPGDRDTLADLTRAALRRRSKTRDPMVGAVQRLDKDTTGVLVFARTMKAKRSLQEQLRAHSVTRRYLAIVHGEAHAARCESSIVQDRGDGLRGSWGTLAHHRGAPPRDAKRAITHVSVREPLSGATLIECRLETGRQHQIRIHLSEAGHPLVGEPVYIRRFDGKRIDAPRPMLHAIELAFDHPRTNERVCIDVAPPDDFEAVLRRLRGAPPNAARGDSDNP